MAIAGTGFFNFPKRFLVLGSAIHFFITRISYKRDWLSTNPILGCLIACDLENKGFKKQKSALVRQGTGQGLYFVVSSAMSNLIPNRYSNSLENSRRDCQLICADTN
jgi:hypothetical protein